MADHIPRAETLHPATEDEVRQALGHALRFDGKKRIRHADDVMARITAEHLLAHLQRSGFVLMKRPPGAAQSTSTHSHPLAPDA